ncbi:hypothetical protein BCR41DRAFT_357749 [Lobosporangium transversale]|uniref:RNA polymerase II elongation factor ELL N-terminal domain-containing protein n=1 Tax=Lobosporangium transversale TaxID=64571 RepID=A0A1Y2GKM2_9FUNG|nr:hypothetical protein BCR41DRAFT_357749 [Lobosporangium transversale]ORZ10315.1 hypothetical protein BCR41DRAFT_357749 [Lobosporangium transversale]|eukprot:XP_021879222.1 hypothetical protein BCR41DRAFT_357749 [Lobosporangium transversale]
MPVNHNDHYVVNAAQPRRQIMELKLSEEVLEEILNGNESIQIDMNQFKLLVGGTAHDFTHMGQSGPLKDIEVYKMKFGTKQLDLVGDLTAKCAIQRTHVKKVHKKATKHEPVRTTQIIDAKDLKKTAAPVRRPQSPLTSSTIATAGTATSTISASTVPASTTATAGTIVPLKTRVVQLLALQSKGTEEKELLKILRVGHDDLQSILSIVANLSSSGRYVLKPETYKEVKIYDWKSYSAKERQIVVKNASAAFDKLGLGLDAPERDILSEEKARRTSPPQVAEGYHIVGNMETPNSKRWAGGGGGGSESEGLDNGRMAGGNPLLKPPTATQKKTSAKKSPIPGQTLTKKKGTSTKGSSKSSRQSAAAAILENVANHSTKGVSTPSSTTKPALVGTPNAVGIGSPIIAGRRPSINGNGNTVSSVKRGSETVKKARSSNQELGGIGNGYKIPKVSSGVTVPPKPQSPTFTVPPISTQAEFEEVSRQFTAKYQEMMMIKARLDKKKELFDRLGAELERAIGTDREAELKRKVQDAFGEDVVDRKVLRRTGEPRNGVSAEKAAAAKAEQSQHMSLRTMAERYKSLHHEVDTMKRALWEAGTAQAEKVAQSNPISVGGGNG